ncbi:hypothetical protein BH23PLA1_BH23PLA1_13940 [soil metagenome]
MICRSEKCRRLGVLNRPFVRYCRRCCRDSTPEPSWNEASEAWERSRRVGWDQPLDLAREPQRLRELGTRSGQEAQLARPVLAIVQGVLALHECRADGDHLALLRPLASGEVSPEIWEFSAPLVSRAKEVPFDPMLLPGGRFLVFSRPGRLILLDLWGCSGLSAYEEVAPRIVELTDRPLASPPRSLGGGVLGLISREVEVYRWRCLDVSADRSLGEAEAVELPLEGAPCQMELVDDRVLALATPLGHWVWRKQDAVSGHVEAIQRTWPGADNRADLEVELDEHRENPRAFRLPRQSFSVSRPGESARFNWVYRVRTASEARVWVEQYSVHFETLEAILPRRMDALHQAIPIGPTHYLVPPAAEMLYRRGQELRREEVTCQQFLPMSLAGIQLLDPLLLVIGVEQGDGRYLQLHSLLHSSSQLRVDLQGIVTDPLIWSRWLFTIEGDGGEGLVLLRRELKSRSET